MHDQLGHDVRFICDTRYKSEPAAKVYSTVGHSPGKKPPENLDMSTKAVSQRFLGILKNLLDSSWIPDIIYSHSGWGCGLYARTVFPNAKIISFAEWWHSANITDPATDFPLKEKLDNLSYALTASSRNTYQALELLEADSIVTPTFWQKSQYPAIIQKNITVIHEGVDTQFFSPKPGKQIHRNKLALKDQIIITYSSRGLEPVRCFPEFIRALPLIIAENDAIRVLIAGSDKIHYYGVPPKGYKTFRAWAESYLRQKLDNKQLGRVNFLGSMPLKKYREFLRISDIHFYFTRPFVASWSLIEAMSSGCLLVAGSTQNTKEILADTGIYFKPQSQASLISSIHHALQMNPDQYRMITRSARDRVCQNYCRHISRSKYQCL